MRFVLSVIIVILALPTPWRRAQVTVDQEQAWTLQLIHHSLDLYQSNVKLISEHPEDTYAIVRDHWGEIIDARGKVNTLVAFKMASSPRLLDLVDIGMRDDNPNLKYAAQDALYGFAFRTFDSENDRSAYLSWRKTIEGLGQEAVIRREESVFFKRLDSSNDPAQRTQLLNILLRADFNSNLPLAQLRQDVARKCNAPAILARFLSPPEAPTVLGIYAVRMLDPDEDYLRTVIAPLAEKGHDRPVRYAALALLSSLQSPTAGAVMKRLLLQSGDPDGAWILKQSLPFTNDYNMIPVLIGVLESEDDAAIDELLQPPLKRLTNVGGREQHDGGWWRLWWNSNHKRFTYVADHHIPRYRSRLRVTGREVTYRRELRWMEIDGDEHQAYWLICPGFVEAHTVMGGRHTRRFGLIVALGGPGSSDEMATYWSKAGKEALNDGYFIAVPALGDTRPAGKIDTRAPTSESDVVRSGITTTFVHDVVADVCNSGLVDRERCYLHAVGDAGVMAYACSLAPASPFHGFYILTSGFKSAVLPPLAAARNRKYYLQYSMKDAAVPIWQATAAAELLKKNGATVHLANVPGDHGYNFVGDPWKPIADAIKWLEASNIAVTKGDVP